MEDIRIVEKHLARDEEAIELTAEKYSRRPEAVSYSITMDTLDSEECVNDTFLSAWELSPPNKPYTYLIPFLARITRSISLNLCKKKNAKKRASNYPELTSEMEQCLPFKSDVERNYPIQ